MILIFSSVGRNLEARPSKAESKGELARVFTLAEADGLARLQSHDEEKTNPFFQRVRWNVLRSWGVGLAPQITLCCYINKSVI